MSSDAQLPRRLPGVEPYAPHGERLHVPTTLVEFSVHGIAKPGGSKRAFPHASTGRIIIVDDSGKAGRLWRQDVQAAALEAMGGNPPYDEALHVEFTFHRARPKGHYGSGRNHQRVKDSAPAHPTTRPDLLKLARAVEDACTGIVWTDDSLIVVERLRKLWGPPRLDIVVATA